MSENRSQDIQLMKLAVQIEKDGLSFMEKFIGKAGEGPLGPFLQQLREEMQADLGTFETLLSGLEATLPMVDIESISLDDYIKGLHKKGGEKFYHSGELAEMLGQFYNPIRLLGVFAEKLNDLADFYSSSAGNIFYDTEKSALVEMAKRKKDHSDMLLKKKSEIISRFP